MITEREIADGCKVVKIHIAVTGFLEGDLGLAQCLVLHLQFDLMHLKFVQQFRVGTPLLAASRGLTKARLRFTPQFGGAFLWRLVLLHPAPP